MSDDKVRVNRIMSWCEFFPIVVAGRTRDRQKGDQRLVLRMTLAPWNTEGNGYRGSWVRRYLKVNK